MKHVNPYRFGGFDVCSYDFNANDDLIHTVDNLNTIVANTGDKSVSLWFKTSGINSRILSARLNANTIYNIAVLADGTIQTINTQNSASIATVGSNTKTVNAYNDNAWHHLVTTFNNTTNVTLIYVDGVLDNSNIASNDLTFNSTTIQLSMGGRSVAAPSTEPFIGHLAEIALFNSVLTSGNVTTLYNGGVPTDVRTSGIGNLRFYIRAGEDSNDGAGGIQDLSGNNYDATFLNMTEADNVDCAEFPS